MSILSLLSRICLTNPLFYSWPAIIFFFPLLLLCGVITVISLSNGCVLCDGWTGSQTHRRLILFEERSVFRLKRPFYNMTSFFFSFLFPRFSVDQRLQWLCAVICCTFDKVTDIRQLRGCNKNTNTAWNLYTGFGTERCRSHKESYYPALTFSILICCRHWVQEVLCVLW